MLAREFSDFLLYSRANLPGVRAEAFALTYLAKYNTATIPARVALSFSRAFRPTSLHSFARVDGGRPAFAVMTFRTPGYSKLVVGIEGTTNRTQLGLIGRGLNSVAVGPSGCRVWAPFNDYATQIMALVDAIPEVQALEGVGQRMDETWAGFSLGAGTAEVIAKRRCNLISPNTAWHVFKFAAPRVGNARWVSWQPLNYTESGMYYGRDPIDAIPGNTHHSAGSFRERLDGHITFYAPNIFSNRYDTDNNETTNNDGFSWLRCTQALIDVTREWNVRNNWFDHDYDLYRVALSKRLDLDRGDHWARFMFLEYDGQNAWGNNWLRGERLPEGLRVNLTPAPEDYVYSEEAMGGGWYHSDIGGGEVDWSPQQRTEARIAHAAPVAPSRPVTPPVIRTRTNWRPRSSRSF